MKIIEITKQKTYYAIRTTEGDFELDGELLRKYQLMEGMEFDGETMEELHRKSRFRRAYRRANCRAYCRAYRRAYCRAYRCAYCRAFTDAGHG
jgi:hypothetical protein